MNNAADGIPGADPEPVGRSDEPGHDPAADGAAGAASAPAGGATLGSWAAAITEKELPSFAQNLSEISSVASQARSSAADLARVITLDVSMSVRLLKIANSPLLNPQERAIDSVRAAVVLMGFDAVRDLAFSLSLVRELHRGAAGDRVVALLAHAFHAGSQAQVLAQAFKDRSPEEAFVAGLLLDVGEMAFWSRARPEAARIRALVADGLEQDQAEWRVLGFRLRELTCRLAEDWRMGALLRTALSPGAEDEPRCRSILQGDAIARSVERHGWQARQTMRLVEESAAIAGMPPADLKRRLQEGTRAAARMARRFGVESIERFLSADGSPEKTPEDVPQSTLEDVPEDDARAAGHALPDPQRELEAVRDLQAEMQQKPDIDRLMRLALEGLHAGAGVDRAFFAVLSQDRGMLVARYAAGIDPAAVLEHCRFDLHAQQRSLFALLLKSARTIWVDDAHRARLGDLVSAEIDGWAGGEGFFAMPIFVRQRPVGLLYADRAASRRALDESAFKSFRFFGEQIAAGLARR